MLLTEPFAAVVDFVFLANFGSNLYGVKKKNPTFNHVCLSLNLRKEPNI